MSITPDTWGHDAHTIPQVISHTWDQDTHKIPQVVSHTWDQDTLRMKHKFNLLVIRIQIRADCRVSLFTAWWTEFKVFWIFWDEKRAKHYSILSQILSNQYKITSNGQQIVVIVIFQTMYFKPIPTIVNTNNHTCLVLRQRLECFIHFSDELTWW